MFSFVRDCQVVLQSSCAILRSHQQWMRVPVCSTTLLAFSLVNLLNFGHSNKCVVASQFQFAFLDDIRCGAFHMLVCHVYIFFREVYVKVFGPFLNWMFSYCWVLSVCVFWVVFLYHMWSFAVFSLSLWLILKFSWYRFLQSRSFKFYFIFEVYV